MLSEDQGFKLIWPYQELQHKQHSEDLELKPN